MTAVSTFAVEACLLSCGSEIVSVDEVGSIIVDKGGRQLVALEEDDEEEEDDDDDDGRVGYHC
jgi:hypothetical protein